MLNHHHMARLSSGTPCAFSIHPSSQTLHFISLSLLSSYPLFSSLLFMYKFSNYSFFSLLHQLISNSYRKTEPYNFRKGRKISSKHFVTLFVWDNGKGNSRSLLLLLQTNKENRKQLFFFLLFLSFCPSYDYFFVFLFCSNYWCLPPQISLGLPFFIYSADDILVYCCSFKPFFRCYFLSGMPSIFLCVIISFLASSPSFLALHFLSIVSVSLFSQGFLGYRLYNLGHLLWALTLSSWSVRSAPLTQTH